MSAEGDTPEKHKNEDKGCQKSDPQHRSPFPLVESFKESKMTENSSNLIAFKGRCVQTSKRPSEAFGRLCPTVWCHSLRYMSLNLATIKES